MDALSSLSRRSLIAGAAALGLGAASVSAAFAAEGDEKPSYADVPTATELPVGIQPEDFEQSAVELDPITDFAAEETYDIVVIGAGVSGVPAIMTALEEGATVGALQKLDIVAANGNGETGFIKSRCSEGALQRFKSDWLKENQWRMNSELFDYYLDHSEEAVSWLTQRAAEAGVEPTSRTMKETVVYDDGLVVASFSVSMPGNVVAMSAIADMAQERGAVIHFGTPCVQLVQDETGRVTGAVGKDKDGNYIKMNATKAVILAAGDYMNNDALVARYCADVATNKFDRRQSARTGDGHILASLAGGRIVPGSHPKQIHDLSVSKYTMMSVPHLMLDDQGQRFFNEECSMTSWNVPIKYHYHDQEPVMYRFFDSAWAEKFSMCPNLGSAELFDSNLVPEEEWGKKGMYKADSIEELCDMWGVDPEPFVASIERYNELCAQGVDLDFGKDAQYMQPIDTPPFYGFKYAPGLAAINGGVHVDNHYQVLDAATWEPIPGLFACGVNAGDLCGGVDWCMPGGCSDGHCITAGRYTVIYALTGGLEPSNPCSFDDIAADFADENGKFLWETPEKANHAIVVW